MPFTYDYPRPMVTVDLFILRIQKQVTEILLIGRKNPPFENSWALPGGFVNMDEDLLPAAKRELREETGLSGLVLLEMGTFGAPGRDPRGRTITTVFGGALPSKGNDQTRAGDDAARVGWFPLNNLPQMAFDHRQIIPELYHRWRFNSLFKFWTLLFLPQNFRAAEFQQIFYLHTGIQITEEQGRRLLSGLDWLEYQISTGEFSWKTSLSESLWRNDNKFLNFWATQCFDIGITGNR